MKKVTLLFALLVCSKVLIATDPLYEIWFVAPDVDPNYQGPIFLNLYAGSIGTPVQISMPANPNFPVQNFTLNSFAFQSINLTPWINMIENSPMNQVNPRGIYIRSTYPISAYYEIRGGNIFNTEIIPLKGPGALGTSFYTPFQRQISNFDNARASIDIVATQDNTSITITPTSPLNQHPSNIPFTFQLNRGQTYSFRASSSAGGFHPNGTYISSTKPIAVTVADDLLNAGLIYGGNCQDLVADQIVPICNYGLTHVVRRGLLTAPAPERVYVIASENGTIINFNGTTPFPPVAAGIGMSFNITNPINSIVSNKPISVFQITGNGCEVAGNLVPPYEKATLKNVMFMSRSNETFILVITTQNGNQSGFTLTGNNTNIPINANSFAPVPGTNNLVSASITLTGNLASNTPYRLSNAGTFQAAILHGIATGSGCVYGNFANYPNCFPFAELTSENNSDLIPVENATEYNSFEIDNDPIRVISHQDMLNIAVDQNVFTALTVIISDPMGRIIAKEDLKSENQELDIHMYPSGVYYYSIFDSQGVQKAGKFYKN